MSSPRFIQPSNCIQFRTVEIVISNLSAEPNIDIYLISIFCLKISRYDFCSISPSPNRNHLPVDQRQEIVSLLRSHLSLFSDQPSSTNVLKHDIDVGTASPIKQHAYRCPLAKRELMKKEADYLLENGLAVPSCSPWSSPCLLAPKSDGTSRFCTDYRKVNAVTVSD